MKKIIAMLAAVTMLLSFTACDGESDTTSSTGSAVTPSTGSTSSVISIVTPSVTPSDDEPENLVLEGTVFDHNEGLARGDEGWYDYYDRASALSSLAGNFADQNTSTGWQPMGTDGDDAVIVTYLADKEEGWYEETSESGDGTVKKYNLHEGSVAIPENWYFTNDEKTEMREQATYADGKVYAGVKFEEAVKTEKIVLQWESDSKAVSYEENGFYFEYTVDGTAWQRLEVTVARDDVASGICTDVATFEAVEAIGYRVVVLECANKWGTKLWEMELYAPEEAEVSSEETSSGNETSVVS